MLSTIVNGILVVGGVCLLALLGFELVHRLVPADSRQRSNDVAGFIYAALGVIYAVLLALVVIAVWEEFQSDSETVEEEANATAEIFWLAHRLPEPQGADIQELCRSYAEEVVHNEWPLMEEGEPPLMTEARGTPTGWTLIDEIRASLQDFEPRTKADEQLYAEGLDQIDTLSDARRLRLVAAEEGVPGVLGIVLIFGGAAAISFTYRFKPVGAGFKPAPTPFPGACRVGNGDLSSPVGLPTLVPGRPRSEAWGFHGWLRDI